MKVHLVSRHAGALGWLQATGVCIDVLATHLDPSTVLPGDVVIGSLPVHLASEVCARGAHYHHIRIDRPEHLRGIELDAGQMIELGARLEGYRVEPHVPGRAIHRGATP